ncbi:hypothetical protein PsorP6_004598 [Peronosclerospora sorghi]|uniref:Uncharacterized protein n=1 Tax=Peronosclerospora sorghi TaxID=230839 RepID=A0ACC0VP89_9STRA|nr:hypothetical protein PsorP6_004598 [Peronosclerospora sorghi]
MLVRQGTNTIIETDARELEEEGRDTCPVLGEQEIPDTRHGIRDVRRIDYSGSSPKRNFAQRIQSRKNRFIQRMLVACHLADPSRDLTFKQEQASNSLAIEKLIAIRRSIFAHSQCVVSKCRIIGVFRNFTVLRAYDADYLQTYQQQSPGLPEVQPFLTMTHNMHWLTWLEKDQVEKVILTRIDHEIAERERIHSLIEERAKLVLDVEYAKRMVNDVFLIKIGQFPTQLFFTLVGSGATERKFQPYWRLPASGTPPLSQYSSLMSFVSRWALLICIFQQLQTAQHECKQATRFILDQLKIVCPHRDSDVPKLLQEVTLCICEQFHAALLDVLVLLFTQTSMQN